MSDIYLTLAGPAEAEFKDRASRFLAYAYPVRSEIEIQTYLDQLRKLHFKANHHCYAWRLGRNGLQFRANDDGEPSGTAGRPILAQIDAAGLTDVFIVVVRYFGGTLLGASGLINAYRTSAAMVLEIAEIIEVVLHDYFRIETDYGLMPEVVQAIHQLELQIVSEEFTDQAYIIIAVRQRDVAAKMLQLKAKIWKTSEDEAETLDWPVTVEKI